MFSQDILFVLLLSVIASATDTDLATNTNILLIILLALSGNQSRDCCRDGRDGFRDGGFVRFNDRFI